MDAVINGLAIYLILMVLFRVTGKRALSQVTTFDFVLLLIVAEATQQALLGEDFSITKAAVVVATLVGADRLADYVTFRFPRADKIAESVPILLVEEGSPKLDRMRKSHVGTEEILAAARQAHGLARMDQIHYAILEKSGGITIVPREHAT